MRKTITYTISLDIDYPSAKRIRFQDKLYRDIKSKEHDLQHPRIITNKKVLN
jgi:hypothetical protein